MIIYKLQAFHAGNRGSNPRGDASDFKVETESIHRKLKAFKRWAKGFLLVLLLLIPTPSPAADPWSKQDVALEAAYLTLHLINWGQNRQIARAPDRYWEAMNPLLGRHPSQDRVDAYFLLSSIAHVGIVHLLPGKYRPYFQGVTIGLSGYCVVRDFSIGLGFRW